MRSDQRRTTGDVEAVAGQVLGRVVGARLLKERDRNQVFAVGEEAILKAYLRDGAAKQARKVPRYGSWRARVPRRLADHKQVTHPTTLVLEARMIHGGGKPAPSRPGRLRRIRSQISLRSYSAAPTDLQ